METLTLEIKDIIDLSLPLISNLSNASALLNKLKDINWCGFYLVEKDYLVLGPFQGEIACTKIKKGKGVCGTSFLKKEAIIVDDVTKFPGHIACSKKSRSEIVVPIMKNNNVVAIIDIDSPLLNRFTKDDLKLLNEIATILNVLF